MQCNQYRFEKYVRLFVWRILFLSLHKFNSIYVVSHYLVSQLFKQKEEEFWNYLQLVPRLRFRSLNVLPTCLFSKTSP